jgi:CheY-like chemotaxis protein
MAKVLIIEDNQQIVRMQEKVLIFEGYEVEAAYNGSEGLEKAKTTSPSIILLDIMMPKMNGIEVLEKLKSDEATKNIPVIMMSNLSEESKAQEAMKKGAVKFIYKGESDPSEIANAIKEVLGE